MIPRMTHCWACLGVFVLVLSLDAGRVVVEGQRLFLLMDEGMACVSMHICLCRMTGGEGGGGEGVRLSLVLAGLWAHAKLFFSCTLVQKQMCAYQTYPNSHKDMGEKCF